jgi:outer membrane protein TolC
MIVGARDAFRPVLLTTALALLGLLPAALSHAMGSETQRPFAIAIVAGLFIVSPAILLFLPLLYHGDSRGAASASSSGPPSDAAPRSRAHAPVLVSACFIALSLLARPSAARPPEAATPSPGPSASELPEGQRSGEATFTVDDARSLLLRGHPRVTAARALEEAAGHDVTRAGLWTNPQVSLDFVQGLTRSSYDSWGVAIVGVNQFLELGGVPAARREAAAHVATAATAEREAVELALGLDLDESYLKLAVQARLVGIAKQALDEFVRAEAIVRARVAAGTIAPYAARRIVAARAEASVDVERAGAEYARMRGELDVAVGPLASGLVGDPILSSQPAIDLPSLERMLDVAARERRDVVAARAREQGAAADVAVARRSVFPGVSARLLAGFGQAPGQWDIGAAVAIPLPVVDIGQGSIAAAESRQRAAKATAEALALEASRRVEAAHRSARRAVDAFVAFDTATSEVEGALLTEALAQFREGRLSLVELVDAIGAANRVATRRLELRRDAEVERIRLQRRVIVGE